MLKFFRPSPLWLEQGLGSIRIIVGLLLVYHGQEVFHRDIMDGYLTWEVFKRPNATILVYAGKCAELLAGIFIFLGLFTRVGAVLCIGTLSYVTFVVGQGKFWYEDQHPFLFVLFGILFLFTGPGKWSLDAEIFKSQNA